LEQEPVLPEVPVPQPPFPVPSLQD
jgi:hypothetical protein